MGASALCARSTRQSYAAREGEQSVSGRVAASLPEFRTGLGLRGHLAHPQAGHAASPAHRDGPGRNCCVSHRSCCSETKATAPRTTCLRPPQKPSLLVTADTAGAAAARASQTRVRTLQERISDWVTLGHRDRGWTKRSQTSPGHVRQTGSVRLQPPSRAHRWRPGPRTPQHMGASPRLLGLLGAWGPTPTLLRVLPVLHQLWVEQGESHSWGRGGGGQRGSGFSGNGSFITYLPASNWYELRGGMRGTET